MLSCNSFSSNFQYRVIYASGVPSRNNGTVPGPAEAVSLRTSAAQDAAGQERRLQASLGRNIACWVLSKVLQTRAAQHRDMLCAAAVGSPSPARTHCSSGHRAQGARCTSHQSPEAPSRKGSLYFITIQLHIIRVFSWKHAALHRESPGNTTHAPRFFRGGCLACSGHLPSNGLSGAGDSAALAPSAPRSQQETGWLIFFNRLQADAAKSRRSRSGGRGSTHGGSTRQRTLTIGNAHGAAPSPSIVVHPPWSSGLVAFSGLRWPASPLHCLLSMLTFRLPWALEALALQWA
jgi:hypothetical protein